MVITTARKWYKAPAKYRMKNAPDAASPGNEPSDVSNSKEMVLLIFIRNLVLETETKPESKEAENVIRNKGRGRQARA
jgi:hypothetical protein